MQTISRIFLAIPTALLVVALTSCESETNAPQAPQTDLAVQSLNYQYTAGQPPTLSTFFPPGILVQATKHAANHNGDSNNPIVSFEYQFDADPLATMNPAPYADLPVLISIGAKINDMFCRDTMYWDDTPGTGPPHMSPELPQTTAELTIRLRSNGETATLSYPSVMEDTNYKITAILIHTWNDAWVSETQHEFYPTVNFEAFVWFIDKRMAAGENEFSTYTRGTVTPR